jgi:adenosylcobyric acid synthase
MEAAQYQEYKKIAMQAVLTSHQRLTEQYQLIIVEGAGSPAEINLRKGDVANMGFAEEVDCPVIIIADIDKGGVFAQLVGTLMLLSESEQNRVIGFVINRFRGDIKLLEPGLTWLEQRTNKPVLGVLPYLHGLDISSEDALITQQQTGHMANQDEHAKKVHIVVLVYPHMSNHTDFDALRHHPNIDCQFLLAKGQNNKENISDKGKRTSIPPCDLIILPGSKNVRSDLHFLREQGWHDDIARHLRYSGKVLGICGGYQMLGQAIDDPLGVEGKVGSTNGLGYFAQRTQLQAQKTLLNVSGQLLLCQEKVSINGYEIHAGKTQAIDKSAQLLSPLLSINNEGHGVISDDGQIAACYLHGLFDTPEALKLFISWLGYEADLATSIDELEQLAINRICQASAEHLDINKMEDLLADWYR